MSARDTPEPSRTGWVWWVVLGVVVVLVTVGVVVAIPALVGGSGERGSDPTPAASATPVAPSDPVTGSPSPTPRRDPDLPVQVRAPGRALLPGATGRVYLRTATGVFALDLATGRIVRTETPDLQQHSTFVAGPDWVIFKVVSDADGAGFEIRDGQPATPLPASLRPDGWLRAGPARSVWIDHEKQTGSWFRTDRLRLVGLDGQVVIDRTVSIGTDTSVDSIAGDGYGGLLITNRGGIFELRADLAGRPRRPRFITRGDLLGVGGRRLLTWDCDRRARCATSLVDQRSGKRTELPKGKSALLAATDQVVASAVDADGQLSPDGTRIGLRLWGRDGKMHAHVIDLTTGRDSVLPGATTDTNPNAQTTWTADGRWFLALTDRRLRAFDAHTGQTRTLAVTAEPLLHLTGPHTPDG